MARSVNMEVLERKIEKAQDDVIRTKKAYEHATEELKKLLDKRDAIRKDELIQAVSKSTKSYEEIMQFLLGSDEEDTEE